MTPALYFDPGTGALAVQFIAAAVAGAALFYRRIVNKVKSVFGKKQDADLLGEIDIDEKQDAEHDQ